MTKSARYEEAREAIAKWLCARFDGMPWDSQPAYRRESYFADADGLLSLADKDGQPYLAVVSKDQRPPHPHGGMYQIIQDMRDAGFVKVEKP